MDYYQQVIDHMKIWYFWKTKRDIFQADSGYVSTKYKYMNAPTGLERNPWRKS